MSTENLTKFKEAAAQSPELLAALQEIQAEGSPDAAGQIAALATEAGYPVTKEEILALETSPELNDEQLDQVAGGRGGLGYFLVSAISPDTCREHNGPPPV